MSGGIDLAVLRVRAGAGEPLQWNAGVVLALVEAVEAAESLVASLEDCEACDGAEHVSEWIRASLAVFDTGPQT